MKEQNTKRGSFVFYRSFIDCVYELPEKYRFKTLLAIIDYGLNDTITETDPIIKAILTNIIPVLDSANQRYEIAKQNGMKGKEYGVLGGRPKKSDIEKIPLLKNDGYSPQKISEILGLPIKVVQKYYYQDNLSLGKE